MFESVSHSNALHIMYIGILIIASIDLLPLLSKFDYYSIQCSDQLTGSYVQVSIITVLSINGLIIIGHMFKRYHWWRKIQKVVRKPKCRVGVSEDTQSRQGIIGQLRLQNKIPHHVTFNSGLISILIPTLGSGVALFFLKLLDISIFK